MGLAAIGALAFAFLGATTFPMVLLALGPVVLGVPHVLADLRYLVSRRGLHRRRLGLLALASLIPAALLGHVHVALAASASVALFSRASFPRRLAVASALAALAALAFSRPFAADLAFAHLHNVVAVALWWLWRPRARAWHRLALALYLGASVAFALGLHEAWLAGLDLRFAGFDVDDARASLAPGVAEPWATRAVVAFTFAQSVHYAAWLRLVPEEDRGRPTPRTFRASWRALRADLGGTVLGGIVLGAAALAALAVAAWALIDLGAARAGYLRAALFHGHLELVALALVLTEGRPAR